MTVPNQGAGVTQVTSTPLDPVNFPGVSDDTVLPAQLPYWYATGDDGSIPALAQRTFGNVVDLLKNAMQNSPNFTGASGLVFEGLRSGISLPLAIIEAIIQSMLPFGIGNFLDPSAALDALANFGALGGDSPLNGSNLFGFLSPGLFGTVPVSSISNSQPNLLGNGSFSTSAAVNGSGIWTEDATVGRTALGAAKAVADGTLKSLLSNPIGVDEGFALSATIYTRWTALVSSGSPIKLVLRKYVGSVEVLPSTLIASISSPPSSGGFANGPGTTGTAGQLTGTYTVPAGVNNVRLNLVVESTATSGNVWFDDADAHNTQLLQQGWVNGLLDAFLSVWSIFGGASTSGGASSFMTSFLAAFGGASNPAGVASYFTSLFNVLGGGSGSTLTDITNRFLHLSAGTGSFDAASLSNIINIPNISGTKVGGLTDTGGTDSNILVTAGKILDSLFGGITKIPSLGATNAQMSTAVSSQASTVIGQSSAIEQILAGFGTGNKDSDDFERISATDLGPNWNITYGGANPNVVATPNGHDANATGNGDIEFTCRKTNIVAAGNHQTSTIVLATGIPAYPGFPPFGSYVDVWVRMSAFTTFTTRTGLRFRINSAAYAASYFIHAVTTSAGVVTETQLANGSLPSVPGAGASIAFEAGVAGDMRSYQARVSGTPVVSYGDTIDRFFGNTGRGWGGKGSFALGTPDIQQWTAQG